MSERETSRLRTQLQNCPVSYIESVGKTDKEALGRAVLEGSGEGTVMRLIMGASAVMPARAMTYAASAIRAAQHIPCEQIQIIHAISLGEAVNGIPAERSGDQAKALMRLINFQFGRLAASSSVSIIHGFDTPIDLTEHHQIAQEAFETNGGVFGKLKNIGAKHGGDAVTYTAAHRAFQDTDSLEIRPIAHYADAHQIRAKRIVSIGGASERQFYLARMAMQSIDPPEIETAQVFTKHLTPPYFEARGGEQCIADALRYGINLEKTKDVAAKRDVAHFLDTLNLGEIQ